MKEITVKFTVEDIQSMAERMDLDWNLDKCEEFLHNNRRVFQDILIERGNQLIEDLIEQHLLSEDGA